MVQRMLPFTELHSADTFNFFRGAAYHFLFLYDVFWFKKVM